MKVSSSRDGLSATCENGIWSVPCLFESSEGLVETGTFCVECFTTCAGVVLWREPRSGSTVSPYDFCYASGWGRRSGECVVMKVGSAAFTVIVPADLWARVCEAEQTKAQV